jgi:hypothetical protein
LAAIVAIHTLHQAQATGQLVLIVRRQPQIPVLFAWGDKGI